VIQYVQANSGVDCIMQCVVQDKSCRSANFRKMPSGGEKENCELLKTIDSDEPTGSLKNDENFDYYVLLQPDRVSTVRRHFCI
jgi:hypothetical protein